MEEAAAEGRAGDPAAGTVFRPVFLPAEDEALFALARPTLPNTPGDRDAGKLADEAEGVAIPTSFFERDGHHYYNTLAMIGPDGDVMGTYRKSHIPDGPGYEEKYYFRPGNDGFKVWDVLRARAIGVGICWDQWYPECRPRDGADGRGTAVLSHRHRVRAL